MKKMLMTVLSLMLLPVFALAQPIPNPFDHTWKGEVLINCDTLENWFTEYDETGSSCALSLTEGLDGQAVQFDWNIGTGNWSQIRYSFPQPIDLSNADLFGISVEGGGPEEAVNTVGFMFADVNNVFHRYSVQCDYGLNQINRWIINLALPKKLFTNHWGIEQIDWSQINRFFVYVERPSGGEGGTGRLKIDYIQYTKAADWPRQTRYETIAYQDDQTLINAAAKALAYILSMQQTTGLFTSWNGEPTPKAWLYDMALVLILLTREGEWTDGVPVNEPAQAAEKLADFLIQAQKADGHWARGWNPLTGDELADDLWVGDQSWITMALAIYARKTCDTPALNAARKCADWLIPRIDETGKATLSTEGNADVWWAMTATCNYEAAEKIQTYLTGDLAWDADLKYWWRGYEDPVIAMDAATWLSAFSRHNSVNKPEMGLAALTFVYNTLAAITADGSLKGLDGMGPISIWHEGMGQYVAAGGEHGREILDMLISRQAEDGSLIGSPENRTSCFGWLSTWKGLAPTAWLYFAIKGSPFNSFLPGDVNGDGSLDLADLLLALEITAGITPSECVNLLSDVNLDCTVGMEEAGYIIREIVAGAGR